MQKFTEWVITAEQGLHCRPAALLVKALSHFKSSISIEHQGVVANAKSILSILSLDAPCQAHIIVRIEGPDADEAVQTLARLFSDRFAVQSAAHAHESVW